MTATVRATTVVAMTVATALACAATPAGAARQGGIAEASRGTVAITVSVAAQARLTGDGAAMCLWSNTATRLLAVTDGAGPRETIVAAPGPGCTMRDPLILAAAGTTRMILVSPE